MSDNQKQCCSFCGKSKSEVPKEKLVISALSDSSKAAICLSCSEDAINHISIDDDFMLVDEVMVKDSVLVGARKFDAIDYPQVVHEDVSKLSEVDPYNSVAFKDEAEGITPALIKEKMDEIIVGQHKAKRTLSVAGYNHLLRVRNSKLDAKISKSNILMVGKTGTGKTLFARTLADILGLPFTEVDATTITTSGYNGSDAIDCVERLLIKSDYDTNLAGLGVIFIDEIDKLRACKDDGNTLDVSGEGAQQALLKIIEGTQVTIKKEREGTEYIVDTSNILFIGGGAFSGIQEPEAASIGFGAKMPDSNINNSRLLPVTNEQINKFGLTKEFIGRFPIKITLDDLTVDDIRRILSEPKNSEISQFENLFSLSGFELEFHEDTLKMIAEKAYKSDVGARGLRTILESYFEDIMFDIPSRKNEGLKILANVDGPIFV